MKTGAASFSQLLDIPKQTVYEGIERAHRGGKKYKDKDFTPIF